MDDKLKKGRLQRCCSRLGENVLGYEYPIKEHACPNDHNSDYWIQYILLKPREASKEFAHCATSSKAIFI